MSYAIPFDTLAFVRELETAGIPPAHAEAQAKALSGVLQKVEESRLQELATKGDVEAAKVDILKWTSGMFAAQTAIIIGAMFGMMKMTQAPVPNVRLPTPQVQEMRLPAPPAQEMQLPTPQTQEMHLPAPASTPAK